MIKIQSNKLGRIFVEEDLIINSFKKITKDYLPSSVSVDVKLDVKRQILRFINMEFSQKGCLDSQKEKNLYNQLVFVLSNQFQISNKIIIFSYKN